MRIEHKYLRNRHYQKKHWQRVRSKEHPFETLMPLILWGYPEKGPNDWDYEHQVKRHFEWITEQARRIENGSRHHNHAPKWYRKMLNRGHDAKVKTAIRQMMQGNYEAEVPTTKRNADWEYF